MPLQPQPHSPARTGRCAARRTPLAGAALRHAWQRPYRETALRRLRVIRRPSLEMPNRTPARSYSTRAASRHGGTLQPRQTAGRAMRELNAPGRRGPSVTHRVPSPSTARPRPPPGRWWRMSPAGPCSQGRRRWVWCGLSERRPTASGFQRLRAMTCSQSAFRQAAASPGVASKQIYSS